DCSSAIIFLRLLVVCCHIIPRDGGSPVMPSLGTRSKPAVVANSGGGWQTFWPRRISKLFVVANDFFEGRPLVRCDVAGKFRGRPFPFREPIAGKQFPFLFSRRTQFGRRERDRRFGLVSGVAS